MPPPPRLPVDGNEFLTTTQGLVGEVVQQVHGGELHDLPQVCKEVQTEGERVGDDKGKFWDHNCVSLTLNKTPEGGSWCLRRLY